MQNLCTTAAYRPVRELIQQERQKNLVTLQSLYRFDIILHDYHTDCSICYGQDNKTKDSEGQNEEEDEEEEVELEQERVITLRPLNMQDFKIAKSQVRLLYNQPKSVFLWEL